MDNVAEGEKNPQSRAGKRQISDEDRAAAGSSRSQTEPVRNVSDTVFTNLEIETESGEPASKTVRGMGRGRRARGGRTRAGTRTRRGVGQVRTRGGRGQPYQPNLGNINEEEKVSHTFNQAFIEEDDENLEEDDFAPSGHSTRMEAPQREAPQIEQNKSCDHSKSRSVDLNRSLPTAMLGGLLGLNEEQLRDPLV